jgi:hypothetical protein
MLQVCVPDYEQILVIRTSIGNAFKKAGERVGEEKGEYEFNYEKRNISKSRIKEDGEKEKGAYAHLEKHRQLQTITQRLRAC